MATSTNPGYTRATARGLRSLKAGGGKKAGPGGLRRGIAAGITARTGKTGPGVQRRARIQAHAVRTARRAGAAPMSPPKKKGSR